MFDHPLSRRSLLQLAGASLTSSLLPGGPVRAATTRRLSPAPAQVYLVGNPYPVTPVWAYDGQVPGPLLRYRQGETLSITVDNQLPEATTVHWHGLRLPNAMDGVPQLTQAPIAPGAHFDYQFSLPDAGTFWYHPHYNSSEQVGRGLHGVLIVEESDPPAVDRDLVWLLDDWRLTEEGALSEDFANPHDFTHGGRIGNTVTLNGRLPGNVAVQTGERLRLRLVNAANARIFALNFAAHRPRVIALDGQPVEPFEPTDGRIVLGPGMRADVLLDCAGEPGSRHTVVDDAYARGAYRFVDLVYADTRLRDAPPTEPVVLAANPLPEPDLARASRHEFVITGGAMGGMSGAMMGGRQQGMRELVRQGKAWAINGVVPEDYASEPLLSLGVGESAIFSLDNRTAFDHPMHLHGTHFRVLSRDGLPVARPIWRDTVLVAPEERVEIAFKADNPGDWMFHCHTLEHQMAGLMGFIRVA